MNRRTKLPLFFFMKQIVLRCAQIMLLAFGLLTMTAPLHAKGFDHESLRVQVSTWKTRLDKLDKQLKKEPLDDDLLSSITINLEKKSDAIKAFIAQNTPLAVDAKTLLDKLGNAPKKTAPPETKEVAEQRAELEKRFAQSDGIVKSATTLLARANQMRERVLDLRRDMFRAQILQKGRSPFALSLWQEGVPELSKAFERISRILGYWADRYSTTRLVLLILAALFVGGALTVLAQRLIPSYRNWPKRRTPPFFEQAFAAAIVSLLRAAPPISGAIVLYGGLQAFEMLSTPVDKLAPIALGAFCAITAIMAISTSLLAPNHRRWRIFPVATSVAKRLNMLILAIAIVYGVDLFLSQLNRIFSLPLSLTILQSALASVIFTGLLVAILRTPFKAHRLAAAAGEKKPFQMSSLLKVPLWGIVAAVLVTTALGYISLARFLTQQTVVTGSILIIAYLAHLTISEFTDGFGDRESRSGHFLFKNFEISEQRGEQFGAVSMLGLNVLLFLTTLPFLALQWGFDWSDVTSWTRQALFGFDFGGLHISLSAIFIALLLFLTGIFLTRMFQRWLDQKILSKSRSQTGAEDSIKTAVGYLGIVISALIALSYTGIGFGNIAIVAGALSLGIGFGLQSIVNNFVSGLILLAERPIKVGDWIGIAGEEGNVRRISVRSTEIETFDRTHIIIPNSELISSKVKNWTLRGPLGRVTINIGISYDADPDEVHDLLLRVTKQHPAVLDYPEPYVVLVDFGDSSLDFSIRAYLGDITSSLRVRSQLRFTILRALRKARIEIPFPQSDIHVRDKNSLSKANDQQDKETCTAKASDQPAKNSPPAKNTPRRSRQRKRRPNQNKKPVHKA